MAGAGSAVTAVPLAHRERGAGAPLLLVAGTGYPGGTWPPDLVDALARTCRVITFDYRGTGATPGTDGAYSTRLFAADAVGLLDDLGIGSAHVLGHSMGGRVAQWMALDRPDRIRSLLLAASGPGQIDPARPPTRGVPLRTALELVELGQRGAIEALIRRTFFTDEYAASHPDRVAWLIDAFWSHRPSLEDYLKHVIARQEHETAAQLAEMRCPTLVIVGDRDTHVGGTGSHLDQSRYLAEHIPGAELRVIPGAMHGFLWSDPEASVTIVRDWIERREAARAARSAATMRAES